PADGVRRARSAGRLRRGRGAFQGRRDRGRAACAASFDRGGALPALAGAAARSAHGLPPVSLAGATRTLRRRGARAGAGQALRSRLVHRAALLVSLCGLGCTDTFALPVLDGGAGSDATPPADAAPDSGVASACQDTGCTMDGDLVADGIT